MFFLGIRLSLRTGGAKTGLRKAVFWLPKGRQSQAERPQIALQKTAFCNALCINALQERMRRAEPLICKRLLKHAFSCRRMQLSGIFERL